MGSCSFKNIIYLLSPENKEIWADTHQPTERDFPPLDAAPTIVLERPGIPCGKEIENRAKKFTRQKIKNISILEFMRTEMAQK